MSSLSSIFIFTAGFPCDFKSEPFLLSELPFISKTFSSVYFIPQKGNSVVYDLPDNCKVIFPSIEHLPISLGIYFVALKCLLSDLPALIKKRIFLKTGRYNFSLVLSSFNKAKYYNSIIKKADQGNLKYVYSYWSNDLATICALVKKNEPSVIAFSRAHGFDVFEEQTRFGFIPFRKLQLNYLDRMFSVSEMGQKHLQELNKNFSNKIKLAYLGTSDHGISEFKKNEFVIVSCAYLRKLKGVESIPDVLMKVRSDVTWIHIGGGELLDEITTKCKSLPSNIKYQLLGNLSPEEITDFYKKTNISLFLSLSEREGLPVTLMEAISFGIPIAATDVGGCKEIANENTGFLISKNFSADSLAKKIDEFFISSQNTEEFRAKVKDFWKQNFNANKNYKDFYDQIVEFKN
ncbi:MAG: glycosyltransferase [Bacteroidota bacterium]